jgi:hypothetical protein
MARNSFHKALEQSGAFYCLQIKRMALSLEQKLNERKSMTKLHLYPAPPNQFGIMGSNIPLSDQEWQKLFDGPISAIEPDYQAELAKPLHIHPADEFLWERRN